MTYAFPTAPPGIFMDDGNKPSPHGYGITPGVPGTDGLVFRAPIWEGAGSQVQDIVGGLDGTFANDPSWVITGEGPAINFAGAGTKFVDLTAHEDALAPGTNDFTLAIRLFLPAGVSTDQPVVFGVGNFAASNNHWCIAVDAGFGDGRVFCSYSDGTTRTIITPTDDIRGKITDVVMRVVRGDTLKMFIDGVENKSVADVTAGAISSPSGFPVGIGAMRVAGDVTVCSATMWHRAITSSEILDQFRNPYRDITPGTQVIAPEVAAAGASRQLINQSLLGPSPLHGSLL